MLRELLGLLILSRAVSGTGLISFRHGVNLPTRRPLIIAHRGASGILPEHTRKIFVLLIYNSYEKCSILKKSIGMNKNTYSAAIDFFDKPICHQTYLTSYT